MSIHNLEHLFHPRSVAVIGASERPHSVGATVFANLHAGGFGGPVYAVNPKYRALDGRPCYRCVAALPEVPELAVICTPPATVPGLIAELGERGTRAAVVLTAGLAHASGARRQTRQEAMLGAARPYRLRILGPNCVGLMVPGLGLNASFAHASALPGKLAFVSQSGALTTAVLDWARSRQIGFSHFISLGDSADIDLADVLDYLGSDPGTQSILLYVEAVRSGRKFMSAARAAARNKPVLIIKAGRVPEGAKAATSHTGALAGADDIYDAAIRRAGMLRVHSTEEMFDAAETLARARPLAGERLAIMSNGGGAGVMATDALILGGGRLAAPGAGTVAQLDAALPPTRSHGNPVDIVGDAPVERYLDTLKILGADPGSDAILLIHAPTAMVPGSEIAMALTGAPAAASRPVFTCWMGGDAVSRARQICRNAGLPTYDTPEQAVRGFLQAVAYGRNQELLMETPPSVAAGPEPDSERARQCVRAALAAGRAMLTEPEARTVLGAYGIPVVETRAAGDIDAAVAAAEAIGFPVAAKIMSRDITHKSDVGGVALDLQSAAQLRQALERMQARIRAERPDARLDGFTVQRMIIRPGAFELILGATTDPVFGPVVLFGQGGTAAERIGDRAIALPPLNVNLAKELVGRTRIAGLLAGYRDRPAIDHDALYQTLMQLSQLLCDLPEIVELDINPLLADSAGVLALDARIGVAPAAQPGAARLAIRPYPKELEETVTWRGAPLLLRPVHPEDEPAYEAFFAAMTPEDIHMRFFCMIRQPAHSQLARMTQIDYAREMAFVAIGAADGGQPAILGEARAVTDPDNLRAEFAVAVRSDCKHRGIGGLLMNKLVAYCRARGTRELVGTTLATNTAMLRLASTSGIHVVRNGQPASDGVELSLVLAQPDAGDATPRNGSRPVAI
ncbi:bifunctional acetate--CoA ligase family protein/GNAT family N-acetyltransferase [Cupriavidus basilensis]|uniref:Bifunctional acetate--CoA ligase family protein/GNAT family N-acetyltransferase n=1 Tax=Cupriavidus basilensis TaxID=68895 RepID=A0ABT6AM70_9BURK|nr:bifunctional acetate--CoA ligase family protein/GNAT family N-acetyltransferase [Cupriavidus basilensis]MDF3833397.1 bifunctional acetate--CoA ligase family protein/GNAT family N-acetyltransferase [Cupriavidus basilensis]